MASNQEQNAISRLNSRDILGLFVLLIPNLSVGAKFLSLAAQPANVSTLGSFLFFMRCHQCTNPAFYRLHADGGTGIPLCVSCYERVAAIKKSEIDNLGQTLNLLLGQFEMQSGVSLPRVPIFAPPTKNHVTMHNVNLSGANVGILNTGTIEKFNGAVSVLAQTPSAGVAAEILAFVRMVQESKELDREQQNEIIELLTFLVERSGQDAGVVPKSVTKTALQKIVAIAAGANSLTEFYNTNLKRFFDNL